MVGETEPVFSSSVRSAREGARRPVDAWFAPTEDGTCQRHVAGETARRPVDAWFALTEDGTCL